MCVCVCVCVFLTCITPAIIGVEPTLVMSFLYTEMLKGEIRLKDK